VSDFKTGVSVVSMVTGSGIDKDAADPTARRRGGGGQNIHYSPVYCLFFQRGFFSPTEGSIMKDVGVT